MIFPKEIIDNSIEYFQYKNQVRSKVIFVLILILLITAFGAMPFLKTDIYVTGSGIIKPDLERKNIVSPTTGFLITNVLKNNFPVLRGDTLLVFDDGRVKDQILNTEKEKIIVVAYIADLNYLFSAKTVDRQKILRPVIRTDYLKYEQRLRQLDLRIKQSKSVFDRQSKLFKGDVISRAEYEKATFDYELLIIEREQLIKDQQYSWESEFKAETLKLIEYQNRLQTLHRNLREYVFLAPISGTLFNVKGVEKGNYVNAGELLAEISPTTDLIVETFISPGDIGLIREAGIVNYQVDAYNYNNWGLATGEIIEISDDLESINNQPVFKVRSTLNETNLQLKNGFQGKLKKGLTLRARYLITERSFFDLLYDKLDDWLNPSQNQFQNLSAQSDGIN